jgi:hypothetical protein
VVVLLASTSSKLVREIGGVEDQRELDRARIHEPGLFLDAGRVQVGDRNHRARATEPADAFRLLDLADNGR